MEKIYKALGNTFIRAFLLIPPYLIASGIAMDLYVNITIKDAPYNPDYPALNIFLVCGFFICFFAIAIYIAYKQNMR